MRRILVVEDEDRIQAVVRAYLEREGFVVACAGDGAGALAGADQFRPHVIILDLILPDMSGEAVCTQLRRRSDVPILMLTARSREQEIVRGLQLGADDYVTKPFSPAELVARVQALLRRARDPAVQPERVLSYDGGRLVLDPARRRVRVRGEWRDLTPSEWEMLWLLARHPGLVWRREDLVRRLRGDYYEGDTRMVDTHIKSLRAKVEADTGKPQWIRTVWGVGYKFGGVADA